MIINALSRKQEDLATAREKIQANRKGRIINQAAITKIPVTVTVIYTNKTAVIYLNKTPNLLELENPRGVRLSHPEISKRLGGIMREAVNRLIRPKVNKKLRAGLEGV